MTPGFALELIEKMYTAFWKARAAAPVLAPEGSERPRAIARRAPHAAGAERGRRAGEAARRRASRSRVGPTSSSREHTDRTTRTSSETSGGLQRVELRVAERARGRRRRMQKAKSAPPLAVRFEDPDAAAGDRGESARRLAMEAQPRRERSAKEKAARREA